MFDYVRSSYPLGEDFSGNCHTKEIEDGYGGSLPFLFSTIIAAMIKPHQWILFAMNLAVDMWTEDYYEFLSQLDGEYE